MTNKQDINQNRDKNADMNRSASAGQDQGYKGGMNKENDRVQGGKTSGSGADDLNKTRNSADLNKNRTDKK